jgi:hypothetical protein
MPYGSVYKIVFPHGKHYIGQTKRSLKYRHREHIRCAKNGDTLPLYNALRCHDMVDTFELIEIDTADTPEELSEKEIKYILEYNSFDKNGHGYNMTYGGEGTNGYVYTEADKQKISEAQIERFQNSDEIKKLSEAMKKFWNKLGSKEKMSQLRLISQSTPEAKQNMSVAQKKRFDNPKEREKNSEAQKEHHKEHPERRKQHSETMQMRIEDNPKERERMMKMQEQYWADPESRKKASERVKTLHANNPLLGKEHGKKIKQLYDNSPGLREKCSESQKTRFNNPREKEKILDAKGQNKPFDVFKDDGTFIKTFNYQFRAKEYLQTTYDIKIDIKVGPVLKGDRRSSAGFVFKYKQN